MSFSRSPASMSCSWRAAVWLERIAERFIESWCALCTIWSSDCRRWIILSLSSSSIRISSRFPRAALKLLSPKSAEYVSLVVLSPADFVDSVSDLSRPAHQRDTNTHTHRSDSSLLKANNVPSTLRERQPRLCSQHASKTWRASFTVDRAVEVRRKCRGKVLRRREGRTQVPHAVARAGSPSSNRQFPHTAAPLAPAVCGRFTHSADVAALREGDKTHRASARTGLVSRFDSWDTPPKGPCGPRLPVDSSAASAPTMRGAGKRAPSAVDRGWRGPQKTTPWRG